MLTVLSVSVDADVGTVFQSYYGGIPSARGVDDIYFMGIIDILQVTYCTAMFCVTMCCHLFSQPRCSVLRCAILCYSVLCCAVL